MNDTNGLMALRTHVSRRQIQVSLQNRVGRQTFQDAGTQISLENRIRARIFREVPRSAVGALLGESSQDAPGIFHSLELLVTQWECV